MITSWAWDSFKPAAVMRMSCAFARSSSIGAAAGQAHAAAHAAGHLRDERLDAALVGDHALDALGHELGERASVARPGLAVHRLLEVAVRGAFLHRAERAHAAVGLEGAALVEDRLAGRLLGPGEQRADHHDVGAGGDRLGDVAGELDAAVGDERDLRAAGRLGALADGVDLRNAGAGDDARRADRAGADADLDGVGAALDEVAGALLGGDVAGDDRRRGKALAHELQGVEDALAVAVRGVEHEDVDLGADELPRAVEDVLGDADGGAHAQAPEPVLGGVGVLDRLLDVLDGDEALEVAGAVHDQELLDAVLVEELLGLLERRADGRRDEVLLRHARPRSAGRCASRSAGRGWSGCRRACRGRSTTGTPEIL